MNNNKTLVPRARARWVGYRVTHQPRGAGKSTAVMRAKFLHSLLAENNN